MNERKLKIGMSYWGSLSGNLKDSPDGAIYFRNLIIKKFLEQGHTVLGLQLNRDEETFKAPIIFDYGLPELDILFIEWRWELPGRNTPSDRYKSGYTPDLERQDELLFHYLKNTNTHVFIWDKDQTLTEEHLYNRSYSPWFFENGDVIGQVFKSNVHICRNILENQWLTMKNGKRLYFKQMNLPCDFNTLQNSAITNFNKPKDNAFVYIGNQYRRDEQVYQFIVPAACHFKLNNTNRDCDFVEFDFYGNWTKYKSTYERNLVNFPGINFHGRVVFSKIHSLYHKYMCTLNMAPKEYMDSGQFTQRVYEAVMNGVMTIGIGTHHFVDKLFPEFFIVNDAYDLTHLIEEIVHLRDNNPEELRNEFESQINKLEHLDILHWYNAFYKMVIKPLIVLR